MCAARILVGLQLPQVSPLNGYDLTDVSNASLSIKHDIDSHTLCNGYSIMGRLSQWLILILNLDVDSNLFVDPTEQLLNFFSLSHRLIIGLMGEMALNGFNYLIPLKGLNISSWNMRSIQNNFQEIELIMSDGKIDIFCLNETWLDHKTSGNSLKLPGYILFRLDRKIKK